jgi:N-acetylglucosaminyldiphosphoundecaprenol N-acetyl-beta-D-mannosaminyltransferase
MDIEDNQTVNILGVRVGTQNSKMLIQFIADSIENGNKINIAYINIHTINQSLKDPWFREYLNRASRTYCDGYGVKLGAFLLGHHIPERYTAPDWLPELVATCVQNNYSMFFLGAKPNIAERAAANLIEKYPNLQIVGSHHGYFNTATNCHENESVIQMLNSIDFDILVLGLGTPLQEKWLDENWSRLNCLVALPVGAAFDYLAGEVWRAPRWMTDHGLEWLGRLIINPKQFWRRYLLGIPSYMIHILKQKFGLSPR